MGLSGPVFGADDIGAHMLTEGLAATYAYCSDPSNTCYGAPNLFGQAGATPFHIDRLEVFTIAQTSEVPLPAALPLFATVFAGGGVIAWRRKRKAAQRATS
jgi:hypothetical protein